MLNITDISWITNSTATPELRCPICNTIEHHHTILTVPHMRTGKRMNLYQCKACNTRFYTDAVESSYDDTGVVSSAFLQHYLEAGAGLWEMLWPIARLHNAAKSSLLDVGCGYGFSVDMWGKIFGNDAIGVETAEWGEIGRTQLGVTIHRGMLDEIPSLHGQTYDIVYACEVIEHVSDPRSFLKSLSSRVAVGGTLVLTTPAGDFIEKGNDEKDILAALLPGGHLFLLSAQAFTQLLQEAGFTYVNVISARERLIAYASHSPIELCYSDKDIRQRYIKYLTRRLGDALPGTPFHDGFAYRLFKELVALGEQEQALQARKKLDESMAIRFAGNQSPVFWVDRAGSADNFDDWANSLPFFIGSYCFFRGELERISGHDKLDALSWLEASIETSIKSSAISPLFFTEAIYLMWAAMTRCVLLCLETNRTDGAMQVFEQLCDARSGEPIKYHGVKPELDLILESALLLLTPLIGPGDANLLHRFSCAIDHALASPSTDIETAQTLQALSASVLALVQIEQGDYPNIATALSSSSELNELNIRAGMMEGKRGEQLRSVVTVLMTHIAITLFSKAVSMHQSGRLDQAQWLYEKVISLDERHADAMTNLSIIHLQAGRLSDGFDLIERSLKINPDQPDVLVNYGNLLQGLNRIDDALSSYNRAIALSPDYAEAFNSRGILLHDLNRTSDALENYDQAISLAPEYAEAHNNRGLALFDLGQLDEAIASYSRAIALKGDYAQALNNRGNALNSLKRLDEALKDYDSAITLFPQYAEAYSNRAAALCGLKRFDEALSSCERAIAIGPDDPKAYSNLGNILSELKRFDEALHRYDQAIALKPDFADVHCNRGNALKELMRLDEALASYERAIELKPDFVEARWNTSLILLMQGNYAQGWPLYEWRWQREQNKQTLRDFNRPLWLGKESLQGKTILLYAEQGLGDTLQFCRYVPLLEAHGAKVVLEVQRPLASLVGCISPAAKVIIKGSELPSFDYQCPLMSLPTALNTLVETIPAKPGYLFAPTQKQAAWHEKLGPPKRLRVGLAWSGNPEHKNDLNRSIALRSLLPLFETDAEFHCLQKEIRDGDAATLAVLPQIRIWSNELQDFTDTAGLLSTMDLIISVDTAVAHLSAAMGKPTWVLLPFTPDFRWLTGREDSPWYPTVHLFRQPQAGDWTSVIQRVTEALYNQASQH